MSAKRLQAQGPTVQAIGFESFSQPAPIAPTPVSNYISRNELSEFKQDMLAAKDARIQQNMPPKGAPRYFPARNNKGGARGRNLRTTDGQPICNKCEKVGHVARYYPATAPASISATVPAYPSTTSASTPTATPVRAIWSQPAKFKRNGTFSVGSMKVHKHTPNNACFSKETNTHTNTHTRLKPDTGITQKK